MHEIVEKTTKMNQELQNQKLRLLAKVDLKIKLKIFQEQKPIFHKLKNLHSDIDNALLTLSSLLLAIDNVAKELDIVNIHAAKLRGKNNKSKMKRQKLLGYWAVVKTLKLKERMSFRDISAYFAKYHKLEVSYSTVYGLWIELETNKKEKN
jgi:uncharacterized protein YoxC